MPILQLDDADIHYTVTGEGPPFLFLAATACAGTPWTLHQVREFSRDHRVIVYDQRGTGKSPARSADFSTKRLADDASALLDAVGGGPAILAGHSNGGRVAQQLAVDHPGKVARLILVSAGGTHGAKGIPIPMIVGMVEQGYEQYFRGSISDTGCTRAYYAAHKEQVDAFLDLRCSELPPLEVYLGHVLGRQASDTTARLGEIRVPTLVLVGDDEDHGGSPTHLQFAKILAERIPGAKLVVFPDAGHYYAFLTPERTNAAIRAFLAG